MFAVQGMQQVHRQTRASVTSGSCSGGSPAPRTVPNIQFLFLVFLYFVFCILYVICIFCWHLYWKSFAGWKRSASNFDQNLLRMASAAAHIDRQHWRLQRLKILPLARCSWLMQASSPAASTINILITKHHHHQNLHRHTLSPWQDAFFALFQQLSALQALCSVHCVHYFSTFQETTFQGGTIDGANYANFKSMFVCLYFEFCILYFQSDTRDDANDANFKSILRNPGQKSLRENLPAVMQPVFQPSCNHVDGNNENVENVQRIKML